MSRNKLSYVIAVLILLFQAASASAQGCPENQPTETDRNKMFKKNHTYSINLPDSLAHCRSQFEQATSLWAGSGANIFGVTFAYTTDPYAANLPVRHVPPDDPTGVGQISPQPEYDPGNYGYGFPNAVVRIHPNTTDCGAPARTFSHELGHAFGLADCYFCSNTIMTAANGYNDTSGPVGPTSCDEQTVKDKHGEAIANEPVPETEVPEEGPASGGGGGDGDFRLRESTGGQCFERSIYSCPWNYTHLSQCQFKYSYTWCT